jgi:O-antigen/teichoic acid export membrane protein
VGELLNKGLVFAGFFAIPGLFGGFVVGTRVLEIFGPAFGQGWMVLVILITARLSNTFSGQFKNTVNALDRPDLGFRINAGFILTNLVLNLSLIPVFGWSGAAVATSLSSILMLVLSYYYVNTLLSGIVFPITEIGKEIAASVVMIVPVYLLTQAVPASEVTTVGIVFIGAAVYTVIILEISPRIRSNLLSLLPERYRYDWFY